MNTEKTLKLTPDVFTELTDSELLIKSAAVRPMMRRQLAIWIKELNQCRKTHKTLYQGRVDVGHSIVFIVEAIPNRVNAAYIRQFFSLHLATTAANRSKFANANDQNNANYFAGKESAMWHFLRAVGIRHALFRFCIESAEVNANS